MKQCGDALVIYCMSWTCPDCERELPWKDYRHYCARVSLDSLFEGRSPELVLAFDKILAEVADWLDIPGMLTT